MNKPSLTTTIKYLLASIIFLLNSINCHASLIFINEIHYDNSGADQGEFVELAGTAGINLLDWSLQFYNGSNGLVYKTTTFSDVILDNTTNGFGFITQAVSGIQNGAANGIGDGIALVDNNDQLIQFISYEGAFKAIDGPASGIFSKNISISENASPIGKSLQLTNSGNKYDDFEWVLENETAGAGNIGQHFINIQSPPAVLVSEPNLQILFILFIIWLFTKRKELTSRNRANLSLRSVS